MTPRVFAVPLAVFERDGLKAALKKAGLSSDDVDKPDLLFWRFETEDAVPVGLYGGSMVDVVSDYVETYPSAPARYEAGSPNYPGVVAMLKAIDILKETGFEYIVEHEQHLMRKTIAGLQEIGRVTLYGDTENIADKVGIIVFNIARRPTAKLRRRWRKGVLSPFARALFARTLCVATAENSRR